MSASDQIVIPGTRAPERQTKARLFKAGHSWTVTIPTPFGHPFRYHTPSWTNAVRFLDQATRRRRRSS